MQVSDVNLSVVVEQYHRSPSREPHVNQKSSIKEYSVTMKRNMQLSIWDISNLRIAFKECDRNIALTPNDDSVMLRAGS